MKKEGPPTELVWILVLCFAALAWVGSCAPKGQVRSGAPVTAPK
jgi:hypothetical protein